MHTWGNMCMAVTIGLMTRTGADRSGCGVEVTGIEPVSGLLPS